MGRTYYCANCLNSFQQDVSACPNLSCGAKRPEPGWGRLLGEGDLLDRHYHIDRVVAAGGAGITYLGRELGDDDAPRPPELAIKVLFQTRDSGPFLRRLANEAQILQDLAHPHIVECRGFVNRIGREPYLLTRFEKGGSLFDHMKQAGPLSVRVAALIVDQILDALHVAHQRDIIHRDLKPQNVLLRREVLPDEVPHCLVADFGIAKVSGALASGLTQVGSFVGTPEFAAPEQFKGLPPTPATDVFAAGALLYFLIAGKTAVHFSHRSDILSSLKELVDWLPPKVPAGVRDPAVAKALKDVLAGMMKARAESRWPIPKIRTALDALSHIARDAEAAAAPAEPDAPAPMGTMIPGMFDDDDDDQAEEEQQTDVAHYQAIMDALVDEDEEEEDSTLPPGTFDDSTALAPTAPEPEPPEPESPPPPAAMTRSEPPARPGRLRFRDSKQGQPSAATPTSPSTRSDVSLDDLFGSAQDSEVVVHQGGNTEGNDLSLDDLFADPKPEPTARSVEPERLEPEIVEPEIIEPEIEEVDGPVQGAISTTGAAPGPWEPEQPTPLPDALPEDADGLLALLGSVRAADRPSVIEALSNLSGLTSALSWTADRPKRSRGVALWVEDQGDTHRARVIQRMLEDDDPGVRCCAAAALATVGSASALTRVSRLTADPDPTVRSAAALAIARGCVQHNRQSLGRSWLRTLQGDGDPNVQAAVENAMTTLQ